MNGKARVAVLTPPGTGAIATVEVVGPEAWGIVRGLFHPSGKSLPLRPKLHRFWYGNFGNGQLKDEVILAVAAVEPELRLEIHCHGGQRIVRWVVELLIGRGCLETLDGTDHSNPWHLLAHATTLRTASILLDQAQGAFARTVQRILELLESNPGEAVESLRELTRYASLGRHIVTPWKVVIAGPPNVGKSSLMNALAGFQRAVVSEIEGTTRDVVTVPVAFDGWPVELTDTAGLRDAEGLEARGIERAKKVLHQAELVLWMMDASLSEPVYPEGDAAGIIEAKPTLFVINKSDRPSSWSSAPLSGSTRVSALTGQGICDLVRIIANRLVPEKPAAGVSVPYTERLADLVIAALDALICKRMDEASRLLRECLPAPSDVQRTSGRDRFDDGSA